MWMDVGYIKVVKTALATLKYKWMENCNYCIASYMKEIMVLFRTE